MKKAEVRKSHSLKIKNDIKDFKEFLITNALIKEFKKVNYEADVYYIQEDDVIEIVGRIDYTIKALDARDGSEIEHTDQIEWNDEYALSENIDEDINIIVGEDVNFDILAIEQINANIPINLSHNYDIISKTGSGWVLMSEDEYEKTKNEQPDPRWDKLKEFSLDSEDKKEK